LIGVFSAFDDPSVPVNLRSDVCWVLEVFIHEGVEEKPHF